MNMKRLFLVSLIVLNSVVSFIAVSGERKQVVAPVISIGLPTPFPAPKETFDEAMGILKGKSYSADLNDEIVYYSALKGVLRQLSPLNNKELLKLWGPEKDKMVQANLAGSIGSIGIRFVHNPETGISVVSDIMPGTPAEKLGLKLRDLIEAIDGAKLKGRSPEDVAALIEKPVGTKIKLSMRRAGKAFDITVPCAQIKLDDVRGDVIDGYGFLRIRYFNKDAAVDVAGEMKRLISKNVRGVVIDLRGNPGGVFDAALQTADQFLTKGSIVLYSVGRDGAPQRYLSGSDGDIKTRIAVLINHDTASAAEILAAALKDNKRAAVLGTPSLGKGTMENISKLKNGYSMTFTAAALYGPSGEPWQDRGIMPDKLVPQDGAELEEAYMEENTAKRLALDKQLVAAMGLIK